MELTDLQNDLNGMKEYINNNFGNCAAVYDNPEKLELSLYHLAQSAADLIQLCGYLSGKIVDELHQQKTANRHGEIATNNCR